MRDLLRIGLLIDEDNLPAWIIEMLREIINDPENKIVLVIKKKSKDQNGLRRYLHREFKYLLYRFYQSIDHKIFSFSEDALKSKNISSVLSLNSIGTLEIVPVPNDKGELIAREDVDRIKNYNIDVLIKLGFRNLVGDIYDATKYGIWTYSMGASKLYDDSPMGFWEVMESRYDTNVNIIILNKDKNLNKLIMHSRFQTIHFSVNRNLNMLLWKAASFLPSQLRELKELGENEFFQQINRINKFSHKNTIIKKGYPNNLEMLKWGLSMIISYIKIKTKNLFFFDQWILLFDFNTKSSHFDSFSLYRKILPPRDRFYADPFLIKKNNKYYVFFEELIFTENKGFISVLELDENGNYTKPVKVLEREYHLSYPNIFEFNDELYMIPESGTNNKTIEIYRCIEFPANWRFEKVLIDNIKAFDSTILFYDGKYWMFTYLEYFKGKSLSHGLYLFSADEPLSDNWKYHPQNPVIPDAVYSRPAGNFFTRDNKIFRPSQDCSKRYGYGMKINQIIKLTDTEYEEVEVDSIYPEWDKKTISTHTINSVENLTVIDTEIRRRRF